jgi:DNA-binding FadR family transcriptional regulator
MKMPLIVSPQEWEAARQELLLKEKELTRAPRRAGRRMPSMAVEKDYRFEGAYGPASLTDLFQGRHQLIVYRFSFESSVAGDLIRFVEVHWYFHLALLEPLENPLLRRLVGRLIDQTRLYKLPRLAADGELSTSSHGHGDILRAVEQGDAEEAGRLMRGHIESDRDLWTELP